MSSKLFFSAKEAMKIIRKRLQTAPNFRSVSLILTVSFVSFFSFRTKEKILFRLVKLIESLCKNCGKTFHLQLAHRDFLKELKALIGPKNNPPIELQNRVLAMIQVRRRKDDSNFFVC